MWKIFLIVFFGGGGGFSDIFGGGFSSSSSRKSNNNLKISIPLSLEEINEGISKTVKKLSVLKSLRHQKLKHVKNVMVLEKLNLFKDQC